MNALTIEDRNKKSVDKVGLKHFQKCIFNRAWGMRCKKDHWKGEGNGEPTLTNSKTDDLLCLLAGEVNNTLTKVK